MTTYHRDSSHTCRLWRPQLPYGNLRRYLSILVSNAISKRRRSAQADSAPAQVYLLGSCTTAQSETNPTFEKLSIFNEGPFEALLQPGFGGTEAEFCPFFTSVSVRHQLNGYAKVREPDFAPLSTLAFITGWPMWFGPQILNIKY
jgi:hypothetical protein